MKLTPQQGHNVNQVIANLSIEDMHVTPEMYEDFTKVASGEITADEMAEELKRRYTHAR